MRKILKFWVDLGVEGFRVDAITHLVENEHFTDNPPNPEYKPDEQNEYYRLLSVHTVNQLETYKIVAEWTKYLADLGKKCGKSIPIMTEGYAAVDAIMRYYTSGVAFPFNFNLLSLNSKHATANQIAALVDSWLNAMPAGNWPNWVLSNHDKRRATTRMGGFDFSMALNSLLLLLPGTPTVYYGEEIGMVDGVVAMSQAQDPRTFAKQKGRDPGRTPMQWNAGSNAGFCLPDVTPWLPVASGFRDCNVTCQTDKASSHLTFWKRLIKIRKEPAFQRGTYERFDFGLDGVFAFERCYKVSTYFVLLCFSSTAEVRVPNFYPSASALTIVLATPKLTEQHSDLLKRLRLSQPISMIEGDVLVLKA